MDPGLTKAVFFRRVAQRVILVFLAITAGVYLFRVPGDPPGFSIDESSICYNAFTISQTRADEYGNSWPLFFRAFGEYKSPTLIYLLAALFRATGPSIAAARLTTASLGILTGFLLGLLGWKMSRRFIVAGAVAIIALLTPWLFESSRLVFEVALYPALVCLFLLALWRAGQGARWSWIDLLALAVTLSLLTYSYSIGRLLAPLLALGLAFFLTRERWPGVVGTWALYGLSLVPLFVFHQTHPDALTGRFRAITYLKADDPIATSVVEFARHYVANVNPCRWLVTGEGDIRDHLQGSAALLAGSVILAAIGSAIVLRRHRHDSWWRFIIYALVVAPIPASLTSNPFPQLRLVAFPVFLVVLTIPALAWLAAPSDECSKTKPLLLGGLLLAVATQGLVFQWRYHWNAPKLWYVFDGRFARKVLAPALATGRELVALVDEPGKGGYIHALWYGVLAKVDARRFVRVPWGELPPPGSVVITTEFSFPDSRPVARALNYLVYVNPPYFNKEAPPPHRLSSFQANILCENPPATLMPGRTTILKFLIKNTSTSEWPCLGRTGCVTLEGRWIDADGTASAERFLPYDVEPGDTVGLSLEVDSPGVPGDYWLEVDLVQKPATRFSDEESKAWRQKVRVVAPE
jgi:hypothetical protein